MLLYMYVIQEPTETSKQPFRTRYLGHVTGYQPIRDQYFLIRSVPDHGRYSHAIGYYSTSRSLQYAVTKWLYSRTPIYRYAWGDDMHGSEAAFSSAVGLDGTTRRFISGKIIRLTPSYSSAQIDLFKEVLKRLKLNKDQYPFLLSPPRNPFSTTYKNTFIFKIVFIAEHVDKDPSFSYGHTHILIVMIIIRKLPYSRFITNALGRNFFIRNGSKVTPTPFSLEAVPSSKIPYMLSYTDCTSRNFTRPHVVAPGLRPGAKRRQHICYPAIFTESFSVLRKQSRTRNRPNQEILVPDWLITSSDWLFTLSNTYFGRFLVFDHVRDLSHDYIYRERSGYHVSCLRMSSIQNPKTGNLDNGISVLCFVACIQIVTQLSPMNLRLLNIRNIECILTTTNLSSGSGRAADIICSACDMVSFKEEFIDGEFVIRGVIGEEGKKDISEMLETVFNKFTESAKIEQLLDSVVEIASMRKQICLRDVGELMEIVMEGTYHSVLTQDKYNQDMREDDRFDVSCHIWAYDVIKCPNMAGRNTIRTCGSSFIFENNNPEFIFYLTCLTPSSALRNNSIPCSAMNEFVIRGVIGEEGKKDISEMLETVFNKFTESAKIEQLLDSVVEIASMRKQICLRDVGELMEIVMEGTYHSVLTQDKYNQDMREDDRFDNPYDLMVIYSALIDAPDMARFFWENSRTPIATSLIAHKVFLFLDKMEAKWARIDEEMTEKLETSARCI
eukprot:sb/3462487/